MAEGIDRAFQFLQACEFSFPRSIAAVQALVNDAQPDADADYGPFIVGLENWFRPSWMKELDETGIPIPLAERLRRHIGEPENKADALQRLRLLNLDRIRDLDAIDRELLAHAL